MDHATAAGKKPDGGKPVIFAVFPGSGAAPSA
jgi:hypothetical protein